MGEGTLKAFTSKCTSDLETQAGAKILLGAASGDRSAEMGHRALPWPSSGPLNNWHQLKLPDQMYS